MIHHRRTYTDARGRRAVGGWVVASTGHPAGPANGPITRVRFELSGGVLTVALPPATYLLHAELTGADGQRWAQDDYVTLEDPS